MAVVFRGDDTGFIAWMGAHPDGFVLNVQRGLNPSDARVHAASCRHLARALGDFASHGRRLTHAYIKVCSQSLDDLDEWSRSHVGTDVTRCPCLASEGSTLTHRPKQSARQSHAGPDVAGSPYRITVVPNGVDMAGPRYLPFEGLTAEQKVARSQLQQELSNLTARSEEILHAWYSGARPPNSDVENITLYNVDPGGKSFARATTFGVRFELDSDGGQTGALCQYRYRVISLADSLLSWRTGALLASFVGVELGTFQSDHRLAQTWAAIHRGPVATNPEPASAGAPFGVFLEVERPTSAPLSVRPDLVKSLVDGVVCSLQSHTDQSTIAEMARRIALQIQADPTEVAHHLLNRDRAVLGSEHRLVHARGAWVHWSPADHLCAAGQVVCRRGQRWRLSGQIYALTPGGAPPPTSLNVQPGQNPDTDGETATSGKPPA